MPKVTANELCKAMNGRLISGNGYTRVWGIMSRCAEVVPGLLYFDVKGGKGGDRNILEAVKKGAVGVVISKYKKVLPVEDKDLVVIAVPKAREAFWNAVKFYRNMYDIPVVGVTGTSGKTTTKEMITSIFRRRWKVLKTIGNMNLPPFVPSHIMRLKWGYQAAVFEIGMNRPGHVSKQSRVIQPKVGIITNIGLGHVEHLGSWENVVLEKAGIMDGIPEGGYLVLNADDPGVQKVDISSFKGTVVYYGLKNKADYTARDIKHENRGTSFTVNIEGQYHRMFIPTYGRHNVYNALAAIAAARIFGFDVQAIETGLARYRKPYMRLQIVKGMHNSTIINDTYNANPDSVIAGLEVLSTMAKGKTGVAVLGNMLEQGSFAPETHYRVGKRAAELNIDWLVTVGKLAKDIARGAARNSKKMKVWSFLLKKQALNFLQSSLPNDSVVLVKGSRGAYMEQLVKSMREKPPEPVQSRADTAGQAGNANKTRNLHK